MKKRIINVKVLPGESTDGTGRVCIHLLVPDERGPFMSPHMLYLEQVQVEGGKLVKRLMTKPTRCRLACDPRRTVRPAARGGVVTVTMRTDDPRGATCPKCRATDAYKQMMEAIRVA